MPFLFGLMLIGAAPAERRYIVTDFDRLRVDGPFDVVLTAGKPPSARATAATLRNLDDLSIEVEARELRIMAKPGRSAQGVRVEVGMHGLRGVTLAGSGRVEIDKVRTQRFAASLSGSGTIAIDRVDADLLGLSAAGSGQMRIGGTAKMLKANVIGTAGLDGTGLAADHAEVTSQTAGQIIVNARTTARVRASGSGETLVNGGAACTVEQQGRGAVRCGR